MTILVVLKNKKMTDYSLIKNTWKNDLIRYSGLNKNQKNIKISDENKYTLEKVGLPIILNNLNYSLLPFTFLSKLEINNRFFYLLGDIGTIKKGVCFLGLEKSSEKIFHLCLHETNNSITFLNQSLYSFLMCLTYYSNFIRTKYSFPSAEVKKQVQTDYHKLIDNMMTVDHKAMEDPNCFWFDQVDRIKVSGYDAYFSDFDYENIEPLTPEEQKRIDNMDLPF